MLGPTADFMRDAGLVQSFTELLHELIDRALALAVLLGHQSLDAGVRLRFEVAKREVFQLPFQLPDTQAIGQRPMDGLGFTRQCLSQFRFARQLHSGQLPGQYDQHHAHVGDQRQNQPTQAFGPLRAVGKKALIETNDLLKLLDQFGYVFRLLNGFNAGG